MKQSNNTQSNHRRLEIAINRNSLRSYTNNGVAQVFLKDNQEFQLKLTAPDSFNFERWGAEIFINGQPLSQDGTKLVLYPKETIFLDRMLDSQQKLKFKTFEVDNVPETKAARERNGLVEIKWFKEKRIPPIQQIFYRKTPVIGDNLNNGFYYGTNNVSCYSNQPNLDAKSLYYTEFEVNQTETGRIAEGSKSNQCFTTINIEFENFSSFKDAIQLMPISHNNHKQSELIAQAVKRIREYCSECGTRIRSSSWKYCSTCGTKL